MSNITLGDLMGFAHGDVDKEKLVSRRFYIVDANFHVLSCLAMICSGSEDNWS